MGRILFYEKLSDETMAELDNFLREHPSDTVNYYEWREALKLDVKVLQELAESVKEFGERVDEILAKYKGDLDSGDDMKSYFAQTKVNQELDQIGVVPNVAVEEKLKILCKKHY